MKSPFLQLINIGIGNLSSLDAPLTTEQWKTVLTICKKQALLGVLNQALGKLPKDLHPHRRILIQLALMSEKIENGNKRLNKHSRDIADDFKKMGMRSCLLKGQGLAQLYPYPMARQCGDIDLWVEGESTDAILARIKEKWKIGDVWYHHVDVHAFNDKTSLEVHFCPSWMNSPFKNRILQDFFKQEAETQFSNYSEDLGCSIPTTYFNLVFCMVHIYRHVLLEGVGMRQLMDYYFTLKDSSKQERERAFDKLKELGMGRFCAAVMYVLGYLFLLEEDYMLCSPSEREGEFFRMEVLMAGNFGKHDARNHYRSNESLFKKGVHRMAHLRRFWRLAFNEVLWAPYFKLYQRIWRRAKHYR